MNDRIDDIAAALGRIEHALADQGQRLAALEALEKSRARRLGAIAGAFWGAIAAGTVTAVQWLMSLRSGGS